MQRKNATYMGMTGNQLGILAALVVVAVLSICGAVWLLLSISSAPAAPATLQPASPTPLAETPPAATPTGAADPTPAATETQTPPPAGTSAPPGGWVQFQTTGAALWLPDSFVGGDILNHKDQVIFKISQLGAVYKNVVSAMKKPAPGTVLWMIDKSQDKSTIITTVMALHETGTAETSLDQYIKGFFDEKSQPPTINETKKLTLLGHETRRLTYQELLGTLEYMRIDYFVKDKGEFWVVSFFMNANIYFEKLPMAEQSMQTFYLSP